MINKSWKIDRLRVIESSSKILSNSQVIYTIYYNIIMSKCIINLMLLLCIKEIHNANLIKKSLSKNKNNITIIDH